jgi:hypothetical protein
VGTVYRNVHTGQLVKEIPNLPNNWVIDLDTQEYYQLKNELKTIDRILALLDEDQVIERVGLGHRRKEVEEQLLEQPEPNPTTL